MLEQGKVTRVNGNIAWVEIDESSRCAGCGACSQAVSGKMILEAINDDHAQVGDRVEVEKSAATTGLAMLLVFGLPSGFLTVGIILGSLISEMIAIITGIFALGISFYCLHLFDRYFGKRTEFKSRITRIL